MNKLLSFYRWLTAPEPFEFISSHVPNECVSLLESATNIRPRLFVLGWRIALDISSNSAESYSFTIRLKHLTWLAGSGYHLEGSGTITPIAGEYSRVEGVVRTRTGLLGIMAVVMFFIVFSIPIAFLINVAVITKDQPLAYLVAFLGIFIGSGLFLLNVLLQKWAYARLADSVVALLVRTL